MLLKYARTDPEPELRQPAVFRRPPESPRIVGVQPTSSAKTSPVSAHLPPEGSRSSPLDISLQQQYTSPGEEKLLDSNSPSSWENPSPNDILFSPEEQNLDRGVQTQPRLRKISFLGLECLPTAGRRLPPPDLFLRQH